MNEICQEEEDNHKNYHDEAADFLPRDEDDEGRFLHFLSFIFFSDKNGQGGQFLKFVIRLSLNVRRLITFPRLLPSFVFVEWSTNDKEVRGPSCNMLAL